VANIFKTNEVYKHLKHGFRPEESVVAVRGMYVSGEYRPPYYNEGAIRILDYQTTPAKAVSFKNVSRKDEDTGVKVIDFNAEFFHPTITNYTTKSVSAGEDTGVKVLEMNAAFFIPTLNFYKSISVSSGEDTGVKVLEMNAGFFMPTYTYYYKDYANSTPEPMLRLTSVSSGNCIVENYNP
jgi:hypothetical protein